MSNYTHLATEIATSRYVLAASWLTGIDHIIEIGGAKSPISGFIPYDSYSSCNVIDPTIEPFKMDDHLQHHQLSFQEFDFSDMFASRIYDESRVALVLMGVELVGKDDDFEIIEEIISRSSVIIFEHVITNPVSACQVSLFEKMARKELKQKAVELSLKFEYDAGYRTDIVPSFHKTRRFVVYLDEDLLFNKFNVERLTSR